MFLNLPSLLPSQLLRPAVRVNDLVPLQVMHEDERLAALSAAVGPLPAVRPLVHPETALLREALPADRAAVRFLARVRAVVDPQVRRTLEALPADGAPERPLLPVVLLVELELVQAPESLAADHADVAARRWHRRPLALRREASCGKDAAFLVRNRPVDDFAVL